MGARLEQNLACLRVMAGCVASWCVLLILTSETKCMCCWLNVLKNQRTLPCSSLASQSHDFLCYPPRVFGSTIESIKRPTKYSNGTSTQHYACQYIRPCFLCLFDNSQRILSFTYIGKWLTTKVTSNNGWCNTTSPTCDVIMMLFDLYTNVWQRLIIISIYSGSRRVENLWVES
jgi:hypothetical protein